MLTGKRPTDNTFCDSLSLHKLCKMEIAEGILEIVDQRMLMPFVEDQTAVMENKIRKCWVCLLELALHVLKHLVLVECP